MAAFIFAAVFFVYCRTLNPVFHSDDSPETIACSCTLGIQHPPGYPLPTLTGRIFSIAMPGNRGFAVNLQAAMAGAAACVLLFLIMSAVLYDKNRPLESHAAAASSAFCLAFGLTMWSQSLSAKGGIYSLNAALLLGIVYSLIKWEGTKKMKFLYLAAYIYGLSLANHWESMAVATPALALYAATIFTGDGHYKKAKILTAACFVVPGVLTYAYLILRARSGAYLNWGDPSDFDRLLWVLRRAEYSATEQARDIAVASRQFARAGMNVLSEFTMAGLMLAAAGVYCFYKRLNRRLLVFLGALFLTITVGLSLYFNLGEEKLWIMDVFFLPAYAVLAALAGAGMFFIMSKAGKSALKPATVMLMAAALPAWLFASNFSRADQAGNYYSYDFGKNIIRSIATPGIAMLEGDYSVMPLMYLEYVENKVHFCPVRTEFISVPWGVRNIRDNWPDIKMNAPVNASFGDRIRDIVESNYSSREIFVSFFRPDFLEYYPLGNALLFPHGAVMKMGFDGNAELRKNEAILKTLTYRGMLGDGGYMDQTTSLGMSNYSTMFMETGNAFSKAGNDEKAMFYLTRAVAIATDSVKGIALTQLGMLYSKMGKMDEAIESYLTAVKTGPDMAEAYSNMAGVYNNKKEYDMAIAACEKAINIKPGLGDAYNNLAIAWLNKGDREKAEQLMEKASALEPGNEMIRKNLSAIKALVKQ
jgi:hypothetical protein